MRSASRLIPFVLLFSLVAQAQVLENRTPTGGANIVTRKCTGGINDGAKCKQSSDCPSGSCFPYNRVDLSVNMRTGAGAGWTPTAAQLTAIQNNFTAINNTIADISDGQMVLGTLALIVNNGAPNAVVQLNAGMCSISNAVCTNDADCGGAGGTCALGGGLANTGGWGSNGKITVGIGCIQNPLCFAHEFVHLIANARDEYEGALDDGIDNDGNGQIDECNENQAGTRCFGGTNSGQPCTGAANCPSGACRQITCIDPGPPAAPTSTLGCLMQCCLPNTDSELCTATNHDPNVDTEQSQCRNNNSCWTQFGVEWPSVMSVPSGLPDPGPAVAPAAVTFITPSTLDRFVAVIDRSDSMNSESPARINVAVTAVRDFVALLSPTSQFGLASFASAEAGNPTGVDSTKDFPAVAGLRTMSTAADRTDAQTAVDGLSSRAAGATRIGAGLRQARDMLLEAGGTVTLNSSVLLLTDGLNNRPEGSAQADLDGALAELSAAGLRVFVSCIGAARDSVQCSRIADATSGTFVDSATTASLYDAFVEFVGRAERSGFATSVRAVPISEGGFSADVPVVIEPGAESARFVLSWSNAASNLDLLLFRPDGTQVSLSDRVLGSQGEFYPVLNPTAGIWKMRAHAVAAAPGETFSAHALLGHRELSVEAGLARSSVVWPEAFSLNAQPSFGQPIEGCTATAVVRKPDGTSQTIALPDDGLAKDADRHDGLHQAEFRDLTAGDGIYTFVVTVRCQQGVAQVHNHADPGIGSFPFSPSVPTFERVIRFSGTASGVPANLPPVANICRDVRRECTGATTFASLDGTCSTDPEGQALSYAWSSATASFANPTASMPAGAFFLGRNTVELVVTDPVGSSSPPDHGLVVVADTTAPVITSIIASKIKLWPPDHRMVPVTFAPQVVEACDPSVDCTVVSVSSNEPINGLGDGDVAPDWVITADLSVDLRAERSGSGSGRIYTATILCADASGNTSSKTVQVKAPKNNVP